MIREQRKERDQHTNINKVYLFLFNLTVDAYFLAEALRKY